MSTLSEQQRDEPPYRELLNVLIYLRDLPCVDGAYVLDDGTRLEPDDYEDLVAELKAEFEIKVRETLEAHPEKYVCSADGRWGIRWQ